MDAKEKILSDINSWIDYISLPREEINNWSICPFAKSTKNIDIKVCKIDIESIENQIDFLLSKDITVLTEGTLHPNFDVLDYICHTLNEKYEDLIFLPDHPSNHNYIASLETGNKKYSLILAQKKQKLSQYRSILLKKDYYDFWDKDYQEEIFSYGYKK